MRFQLVLVVPVVLVVMLLGTVGCYAAAADLDEAEAARTNKADAEALSVERLRVCKTDSDCIVLKTRRGHTLTVDGLDFSKDSLAEIEKKIPSNFGPRPAHYILRGERLVNDHETLAEQTFGLGDLVNMWKADDWNAEL